MTVNSLVALALFVALSFAAASTGAFFRPGAWYERLAKPAWRPPNRIFAPVWTFLYLTVAISGWLVWQTHGVSGAAVPLAVYVVQLLLNAAWTPIFFGLRRPDLAFHEILLVWASIVATIAVFYPLHAGAALLLVPYLLWVSFAAGLNFSVWQLNRPAAYRS